MQNYIITSRPYGYRKSDFDINEVFETIGFTDENVTAYIDRFFTEERHKTNLKNFLEQNINIRHIAYIPLMLEMICSLWREKAKKNQSFLSPMTMTELYSEVIEYIFFEYTETNNTAYIQDKEDEIFDYLGKIAFEGLKNQVIVLDKTIIKEKKEFFVNYVLKTGFLKSDRKHRNQLKNSYEFPHLTFQEYFSALYVSKLPKEEISEIVRDYKFYPYMQVFFAFLGGLIEDKEFLFKEIESEPKDKLGVYINLSILSFKSQISMYEVNEKRLERIKNILENWLKLTLDKDQNYRFFLEKLEIDNQLINKKIINILINRIKRKKVNFENLLYDLHHMRLINNRDDIKGKESIDNALKLLLKYNSKDMGYEVFLEKLKPNNYINTIIKDKFRGTKDQLDEQDRKILKSLIFIGKNNYKVENALLELIKDTTFSSSVRVDFELVVSDRCDSDIVIDKMLDLIKNNTIDIAYRRDFINSLKPLIFADRLRDVPVVTGNRLDYVIVNTTDDRLRSTAIHTIKSSNDRNRSYLLPPCNKDDRNVELSNLIKTLVSNERGNDKILDVILDFIQDDSIDLWYKKDIVDYLVNKRKENNRVTTKIFLSVYDTHYRS